MDAARHAKRSVEFRAGGSSGEYADLDLLSVKVRVRDAMRQFDGNNLGIP